MSSRVVLVTGGFDPIHSGHISYFKAARELGDILVVGINSDAWLTRKKGKAFMTWHERQTIIKELRMVDYTIEFNDNDDSALQAIKLVKRTWPTSKIIFANGGDRTVNNIPEMSESEVEFVFGVGGTQKLCSSTMLLDQWMHRPGPNSDK